MGGSELRVPAAKRMSTRPPASSGDMQEGRALGLVSTVGSMPTMRNNPEQPELQSDPNPRDVGVS